MGAALTGFGYSFVYRGFGVEAIRRAPAQSQGLAMGAYTAFFDVTLGFASPALRLIGSAAGLNAVFLVSCALCRADSNAAPLCAVRPERHLCLQANIMKIRVTVDGQAITPTLMRCATAAKARAPQNLARYRHGRTHPLRRLLPTSALRWRR